MRAYSIIVAIAAAIFASPAPAQPVLQPTDRWLVNFDDHSGMASFVALIDETGKVADCTIIETSGFAILDSQSCAIVEKRGRGVPGVGADGKPAKDSFIQRVRWQIQ